jgi:hypothetical protein
MNLFKRRRFTQHQVFGTPQNPEAEKHAMSNEEFQALRRREALERAKRAQEQPLPAAVEPSPAPEPPASLPPAHPEAAAQQSLPLEQLASPEPIKPQAKPLEAAEPALAPRASSTRKRRSVQRKRRPSAKRRKIQTFEPVETDLDRHKRKCAVCRHPQREEIEEDFLYWRNAHAIAMSHDLRDQSVVYRHAHATGLFSRRLKNIRFAAAHLADNADCVKATANSVLQAIRACSMINDEGEWVQPPTRMIISTANPRGSAASVANARVLNSQPALEAAAEREISCVEGKFVMEKEAAKRALEILETSVNT